MLLPIYNELMYRLRPKIKLKLNKLLIKNNLNKKRIYTCDSYITQ